MFYIVLCSLLIGSVLTKPSGPGSQGLNCADAEYYGYEDTEGCDFNEAYYDYNDFLAREEVYLIRMLYDYVLGISSGPFKVLQIKELFSVLCLYFCISPQINLLRLEIT